ncbi:2OG-Fe dioxygenase family protein [Yersinia nurmii]|nr:2OG-Fe dioxygenase family protein [Yersinia nurmii]
MKDILLELGAEPSDFAKLESVSAHLLSDPTLPFRQSKAGRFCFNFDDAKIERIEFQPFVLSTEDEFIRHDSGKIRHFRGIGDDLQLNTVFQALIKAKAYLIEGVTVIPRTKLNQASNQHLCTVFNLRTTTSPTIIGEPTSEGVHSDGCDHTMTIFLGSNNIADDSAKTFIHDMKQTTGLKHNDINKDLIVTEFQHKNFLDTLLFADNEKKHSLTPVIAKDKTKNSTRDMLILLTRKPLKKEHIHYKYDSFNSHMEVPLRINMIGGIN